MPACWVAFCCVQTHYWNINDSRLQFARERPFVTRSGLGSVLAFSEGFIVIDNRRDGTHELEPKLSEMLRVFHLKSGVLLNAKKKQPRYLN
ncbi:hypothetical protein CEXT_470061 [Caerostris extrusa]|uniref:Uncharacterized protein n=1 Tax=Caerostris extrusa TaxID=172846 RepID=A0AAV4Y9A6_CAEEX|nr:hypothetical protein CEXT_470061 [Caerostris extrusa]